MLKAVAKSPLAIALEDVARDLVNHGRAVQRQLVPQLRREARDNDRRRASTDEYIADFSRGTPPASPIPLDGAVLVDAMWDNASHWLRYALLRRALGLTQHQEIGLIGRYSVRQVKATLRRFGIERFEHFEPTGTAKRHSQETPQPLPRDLRSAEDVLAQKWPADIPSSLIYDEILRKQKGGLVDVTHPRFAQHVLHVHDCVAAATMLFDREQIGLVVLSHVFTFEHAALAWVAKARGIPVVIMQGAFGTLRLVRLQDDADYFRYSNAPMPADLDALTDDQRERLRIAGRNYIAQRCAGRGEDIGAAYAFNRPKAQISRAELCRRFEWPVERPIITIYASKWFDTPHACGMSNFRDFLDWTNLTLRVATERPDVSWLLKPHPVDTWYGGLTLRDVIPEARSGNMRIADDSWNAREVMTAVDGLVTMHGTAGIEYALSGKPVLCADHGWYSQFGFAHVAESRGRYEDLLQQRWWEDHDPTATEARAALFAGLYYGIPTWQAGLVLPDDIAQDSICGLVQPLLGDNTAAVREELVTIRNWFEAGHVAYHPFKMLAADEYTDVISGRRSDGPETMEPNDLPLVS